MVPIVGLWGGTVVVSIFVELFRNYYCLYHLNLQWSTVFGSGMKSFLSKDYSFHLQMNNAEKIKIFNRGADASYEVTQKIFLNGSKSVLLLIGYIGLVFFVNWQLTLTLLLVTPILMIGPLYL